MPTKNKNTIKIANNGTLSRPPVVAVLGHVDHGKSTLLDYIRRTNTVDGEAGGITQKVSAYEVERTATGGNGAEAVLRRITFLDTPGHEAFSAIRSRGANVADIAILVVSAEDGVRPQTIEARDAIRTAKIPFIVAINKIDKEGASVERTKTNLAENDIYVEGYGGDVSWVAISAKTGQGVPELLDMVDLTADLAALTGDANVPATGIIVDAAIDRKKGIAATLIIKNGTIRTGTTIVAGLASTPVRVMETTAGAPIKEASFSSPVRLFGWSELPPVGSPFQTFDSKKEAEVFIETEKNKRSEQKPRVMRPSAKPAAVTATGTTTEPAEEMPVGSLPLILKAADVGGLDALKQEVAKIHHDRLTIKVVSSGIGDVNESDIKTALSDKKAIILGFGVGVGSAAKGMSQNSGVNIQLFDIIYKLSEWLGEHAVNQVPKMKVEEPTGTAKVLKLFSRAKDKQILGGRVEKGLMKLGAEVKIMRRDFEIGRGRVRELQRQKTKATEIPEGQEFGAMVESKFDIVPGDRLEAFIIVEK